jgi:hypothetical protein
VTATCTTDPELQRAGCELVGYGEERLRPVQVKLVAPAVGGVASEIVLPSAPSVLSLACPVGS